MSETTIFKTSDGRRGVFRDSDGDLFTRGAGYDLCAEMAQEIERLRASLGEARRAENTQCDLRYMETEHRERLEQFVRSLLNPEERGYAVPAHVRDAARVALGMQAVESEAIEACDGSCVTVNAYCPECDRHAKHVMVSDTVRECLTCGALSADLTL